MRLKLQSYIYTFMTSLMTSPGHKIGQILKFIYLRQYLSYSVDQKLKMAAILKILKYQTQLHSGLRYEKIVPNYAEKSFFYGDDVIDDVTGWPQSFSLHSCLGEVASGSKLQGQCFVNKCQYHNCLSRLYMPKDDFF